MRPRHPAAIMIPSFRSSVHDHTTRVSENRDLGGSHFLLTLEAEPIAVSARPGHFVMLRFDGCLDPLLPRPMSVCNVLPPGGGHPGRIQILHKVVGKGTARLSTLKPGERLQVLGPLGRPFEVPASGEAGSLAGLYSHVYADLSLTIPFTAHGGVPAILAALEQAPTSKLLLATDATSIPELFYLGADGKMTAAPVKTGGAFQAGNPRPLFETRVDPFTVYAVTRDGQRFLIPTAVGETGPTPLTVVINWMAGIRR